MSGARFVVVRGGGTGRGLQRRGPLNDSMVVPGVWYSWLLIGGNNRVLGRGLVVHATYLACATAIDETLWTTLTPVLSATSGDLWWRWRLDGLIGGVVGGGRFYRRKRECVYALEAFQRAVTSANPPVGPARSVALTWDTWTGSDQKAVPPRGPVTQLRGLSPSSTRSPEFA